MVELLYNIVWDCLVKLNMCVVPDPAVLLLECVPEKCFYTRTGTSTAALLRLSLSYLELLSGGGPSPLIYEPEYLYKEKRPLIYWYSLHR